MYKVYTDISDLKNVHTQVKTYVYTGKLFLLFQKVMTVVFGCNEYDSIVSGVLDLDKVLNKQSYYGYVPTKKPQCNQNIQLFVFNQTQNSP